MRPRSIFRIRRKALRGFRSLNEWVSIGDIDELCGLPTRDGGHLGVQFVCVFVVPL